MVELNNYFRTEQSNWCPGCGDFAILNGIKTVLTELKIFPHQVVLVSGVGCFAKLPYWVKANGFVGLHGRSLPLAQGIKLANPKLKVIAFGGDGDGYGEGGNHFIHACRRNVNLSYFVHNNNVFALTTGQHSPTSEKGKKSKSNLLGVTEKPINPLTLAISSGATFVARVYAGNLKEMVEIMKKAIQHPGFAFVDIIQPCLSFGHDYFYYNSLIHPVPSSHNYTDRYQALSLALDSEQKLICGVFYQEK